MHGYWVNGGGGGAAPSSKARAAGWSMNAQTRANLTLDLKQLPADCYKGMFYIGQMDPYDPELVVYAHHYDVNVNQLYPELTLCNMTIHYNCMFQIVDGKRERLQGRYTYTGDFLKYATDEGYHQGGIITMKQNRKYVGLNGGSGKGYEFTDGQPIFNLYGSDVKYARLMDIPDLTVDLENPQQPTIKGPNIYAFSEGDVRVLWDGYFYLYAASGTRAQSAAQGAYASPSGEYTGDWWYDVYNPFTYIELKPR